MDKCLLNIDFLKYEAFWVPLDSSLLLGILGAHKKQTLVVGIYCTVSLQYCVTVHHNLWHVSKMVVYRRWQ
jgi:hypothetical protein